MKILQSKLVEKRGRRRGRWMVECVEVLGTIAVRDWKGFIQNRHRWRYLLKQTKTHKML